MLPGTKKINKSEIDCFYFFLATHRDDFTGLHNALGRLCL
jgi:hypothetical protein